MPEFQIWEQQLLPQGELRMPQSGPSVGEAFGDGLRQLVQAGGEAKQAIARADEIAEAKEWEKNQPVAVKILADAKLKVMNGLQELRAKAQPGLADYPDLIDGAITSATEEALKGVTDPRMQNYIRMGMDDYRVMAIGAGIEEKVGETLKLHAANLAQSVDSQRELLIKDPAQYDTTVKTINTIIDGVSAFGPDEKAAYKHQYTRELALTAMHSLIGKDPDAAEKLLASGKFNDALTADDLQAFGDDIKSIRERRRIETQIQTQNAQMKDSAVLDGLYQSALDSAIRTGSYDGRIRDQLKHLPKEQAERLIANLENARHIGQDALAIPTQSLVEDSRLLRSLHALRDSNDPLDKLHYAKVKEAVEEKRNALKNDPAGYALMANDDVRGAWQVALQNLGDPDLLNQATNLTKRMQLRLGLTDDQVRLVPSEIADGILEQVKTRGSASDIAALQKSFGINYPHLMAEIATKAGPLVTTAMMLDQPGQQYAQNALFNISRDPDKIHNLEQLLVGDDDAKKAAVKSAIADKLDGLRRSFLDQPGGEDVFGKLSDSTYALTLYNMRERQEPLAEAAAHAAGDIGADYYKTQFFRWHTYRIPVRYSASGVEQGTRVFLNNLTGQILDKPTDDPTMAVDTVAESLKQYGWWSTLPDESGLMLHFQNGTPATRGGKEITVTWGELERIASHHPSKLYSTASRVHQ